MPQTQWPKHLSQFWRWEVQGECVSKIGFPEASSMACRQLPSLCVLTWPFVCDCASLGLSLSLYCQPHPYDLILPSVQSVQSLSRVRLFATP